VPPPERDARFTAVADQVWTPVRRYLARRADPADVDDLMAEVLLVVWRRLDHLPEGDPLPWAYGVAAHCLSNSQRSDRRRGALLRRLRDEPPTPPPPPADDRVATALRALPEAQQEVLRLWAWEGLEAADIAQVLGLTPGAAASRLSRARSALRENFPDARQDLHAAGHKQDREEKEP
jgi:RNA polymerase sigma-70 factor (ECF subfamily)